MSDVDLSGSEQAPGSTPSVRPYDPSRDREDARKKIAAWLLVLLFAVYVAVTTMFAFADGFKTVTLTDLTAAYITPVIGLVSFLLGFYFGEQPD